MIEPAPGRSSTTKGCLSASDRCWARTREYTSAGPPAPNGTMILTGRVGKSCANKAAGQDGISASVSANATTTTLRGNTIMRIPPIVLIATQATIDTPCGRFNEASRRCNANPAARRSFPRHERGQGDRAECRKGHDGVGGMRILPLPAQLLPIVWDHRPIVGRLIGCVDPDEENDERETDAKKREQRESERRAPAAQQQCERQIGDQRAKQDDAEQAPAPVDVLHDEILVRRQVDLVGELEQMRAARYQRKRREREREKLNDFEGYDRNSTKLAFSASAVRLPTSAFLVPAVATGAIVAGLFAPTAATDKLI